MTVGSMLDGIRLSIHKGQAHRYSVRRVTTALLLLLLLGQLRQHGATAATSGLPCEYWGVGLCTYDGSYQRPERCTGQGRRYCDRAPEATSCPAVCQPEVQASLRIGPLDPLCFVARRNIAATRVMIMCRLVCLQNCRWNTPARFQFHPNHFAFDWDDLVLSGEGARHVSADELHDSLLMWQMLHPTPTASQPWLDCAVFCCRALRHGFCEAAASVRSNMLEEPMVHEVSGFQVLLWQALLCRHELRA